MASDQVGAVPQGAAPNVPGRIGPNAILRLVEAVADRHGTPAAASLLRAASLAYTPDRLPTEMVDEAEVVALHRACLHRFGEVEALLLAADAGRRTGAYLLAHRIPRPAQAILRCLPPALASRALLAAIRRHAWTFAGSGRLEVESAAPLAVAVVGGPLATAGAAAPALGRYYGATFERLYQALVSRQSRAADQVTRIGDGPACSVRVDWR